MITTCLESGPQICSNLELLLSWFEKVALASCSEHGSGMADPELKGTAGTTASCQGGELGSWISCEGRSQSGEKAEGVEGGSSDLPLYERALLPQAFWDFERVHSVMQAQNWLDRSKI